MVVAIQAGVGFAGRHLASLGRFAIGTVRGIVDAFNSIPIVPNIDTSGLDRLDGG